MGIGIMAITGPEGSGKSCLMTAFCYAHVKMGGRLLTFPGYDIHYLNKKPMAELIDVDKWTLMGEDLNNACIAIDEMQNFFASSSWNATIVKLFVAVLAQRRKRNLAIIYTTRNLGLIPKAIRQFNHILAYCWDLYWAYRGGDNPVPRGEQIRVNYCDSQGFFTGQEGTWTPPIMFHAKKYWPLFNSYDVVDIWESFTKVSVKKREFEIDPWGIGETEAESDSASAIIPNIGGLNDVNESELMTQWLAKGSKPEDIMKALKEIRNMKKG